MSFIPRLNVSCLSVGICIRLALLLLLLLLLPTTNDATHFRHLSPFSLPSTLSTQPYSSVLGPCLSLSHSCCTRPRRCSPTSTKLSSAFNPTQIHTYTHAHTCMHTLTCTMHTGTQVNTCPFAHIKSKRTTIIYLSTPTTYNLS